MTAMHGRLQLNRVSYHGLGTSTSGNCYNYESEPLISHPGVRNRYQGLAT